MAHFAQIDENGVVTQVLTTPNNHPDGDEGYSWLVKTFGGRWLKTSYNGKLRKRFAGIGYTYNEDLDAFIAPSPFKSWVIDPATADWKPPVDRPENGVWVWDESIVNWVEVQGE